MNKYDTQRAKDRRMEERAALMEEAQRLTITISNLIDRRSPKTALEYAEKLVSILYKLEKM